MSRFLSMVIIFLILAACTVPGNGGSITQTIQPTNSGPESTDPPEKEATVAVMTTATLAEEPAAISETAAPEDGEGDQPVRIPAGYPILDSAAFVYFTGSGIGFSAEASMEDIVADYTEAMGAVNCVPAGETGVENQSTAILFTCLNDAGEVENDVYIMFEGGNPDLTSVSISLSPPQPISFSAPIPDDVEAIEEDTAGVTFISGLEEIDILRFYDVELPAMNCPKENELGGPNGIYSSYLCADDSGKIFSRVEVGISAGEQGVEVSVQASPVTPRLFEARFPESAESLAVTEAGGLSFRTPLSFEDLAAFYMTGPGNPAASGDCTLVGETGGGGGEKSTAMAYLCTDWYAADASYEYDLTIVVIGAESGSEGLILYQLK